MELKTSKGKMSVSGVENDWWEWDQTRPGWEFDPIRVEEKKTNLYISDRNE